jgi:16S rRNA (guanine527-N7)-methyltransferase
MPYMNQESVLSIDNLHSEAAKLGVSLTDGQAKQLATYMQMLIEYNQHTNLVGNAAPECLLYEHILDSLALLPIINRLPAKKNAPPASLIDIGSGAGFPGLVLAIGKADLKVTALDATNKKVVFLQSVVQALDLSKRVKIINARAEDIAHNKAFRSSFDYATCRAMGALPVVCELTLPFLKPGGYALLQRGSKQIEAEKDLAQKAVAQLGATLTESILLDRSVLAKDHYVLVFKQEKQAPAKYPRQWKDLKAKPI